MTTEWGFIAIVFALLTIALVNMAACMLASRINRKQEENDE